MDLPLPAETVAALRGLGSPTAEHLVPIDPHWEGASRGRIVLPWCDRCESAHWYPAMRCPSCLRSSWTWRDLGTDATLDSWTTVHHPLAPALRDRVPFALGLAVPVAAPHVRLVTVLVTNQDEVLQIGQALHARPGPEFGDSNLLVFATGATS